MQQWLYTFSSPFWYRIPGGKPFLEKFCEKSAYSELDVYTYLSQTLQALNYLHTQQHLIYLDLKPENVILDAQWNCVRLIDFGCAQSIQIRSNGTPTNYESTEFLAPELVSQGPVGTYTDMWAFGVLLYVALRWEKRVIPHYKGLKSYRSLLGVPNQTLFKIILLTK